MNFGETLKVFAAKFDKQPKGEQYPGQKHFDGKETVIDNSRNEFNSTESKRKLDEREHGNPAVESKFPETHNETDKVLDRTIERQETPAPKNVMGETDAIVNGEKLDKVEPMKAIYEKVPSGGMIRRIDKKKASLTVNAESESKQYDVIAEELLTVDSDGDFGGSNEFGYADIYDFIQGNSLDPVMVYKLYFDNKRTELADKIAKHYGIDTSSLQKPEEVLHTIETSYAYDITVNAAVESEKDYSEVAQIPAFKREQVDADIHSAINSGDYLKAKELIEQHNKSPKAFAKDILSITPEATRIDAAVALGLSPEDLLEASEGTGYALMDSPSAQRIEKERQEGKFASLKLTADYVDDETRSYISELIEKGELEEAKNLIKQFNLKPEEFGLKKASIKIAKSNITESNVLASQDILFRADIAIDTTYIEEIPAYWTILESLATNEEKLAQIKPEIARVFASELNTITAGSYTNIKDVDIAQIKFDDAKLLKVINEFKPE